MKYQSTRGGVSGVTFQKAITTGYAPDGGLYVPHTMPVVDLATLKKHSTFSYQQLCTAILSLFIEDEMPFGDVEALVTAAMATFSTPLIIPVVPVGNPVTYVAELWHGSTLAFKDFGQQLLCRLIDYFACKNNEEITLLVSTTGDTGPAAISAVADTKNIRIFCSFPEGQVSHLQRLQMTAASSDRVYVYSFEGGGDDMDGPIKQLTLQPEFAKKYNPCSINSINLGRVVSQTVHFFWSYFRTIEQCGLQVGDEIVFGVPCGALGNVTAGFIAKQMGLPIAYFHCGTNANDIFHRAVAKGTFHKQDMVRTLSEAINIQCPYNFERIMYFLLDGDRAALKHWMENLEQKGGSDVPPSHLPRLQALIRSARVEDEAMLGVIRDTFKESQYLMDPHTAVSYAANQALLQSYASDERKLPVCVLSTAHPCKFEEVIRLAMGDDFWEAEMVQGTRMPARAAELYGRTEYLRTTFKKGEDWPARLCEMVDKAHNTKHGIYCQQIECWRFATVVSSETGLALCANCKKRADVQNI